LKVPEWKWEEISIDFFMGLPWTQKGYNSIWVIVGRLDKVAHFIPVKRTYTGPQLEELYISRIVCLHSVPKKIMSPELGERRSGGATRVKWWRRWGSTGACSGVREEGREVVRGAESLRGGGGLL
jgi:hypothetical protein